MGLFDKFKKELSETELTNYGTKMIGLLQEKKYDEALALHEKYPRKKEGYWYTKGNILTNLNRPEEALNCYQRAIEIKDTYIKAWFRLGQKYFEFGFFRKARNAFVKTSMLEGKIGEIEWNTLATFYYMMSLYLEYQETNDEEVGNKIPNQIRKLRKVIDLDPNASHDEFLNYCEKNFQTIVDDLEPNVVVEFRHPESKN